MTAKKSATESVATVDWTPPPRKREDYQLNTGPGRTKQSFREESNINYIVERWGTENLAAQNQTMGHYGDFSEVATFQEAQDQIIKAAQGFENLPSRLRERFGNDPGRLLDFLGDEANLKEAIELKLVPDPEAKTVPTDTTPPPVTEEKPAEPPKD